MRKKMRQIIFWTLVVLLAVVGLAAAVIASRPDVFNQEGPFLHVLPSLLKVELGIVPIASFAQPPASS
jgi:hypothetical protein